MPFYTNLQDQALKKAIDDAMELLKQKPTAGVKIEKQLWPKEYINEHNITNLFKYDLGSSFRMTYTIKAVSAQTTCVLLEVMNHKEYDKRFGYKTS